MAAVPIIQGWCPGALRPMVSGDGLVVRVRPRGGRLSGAQAAGIARAARAHGNGMIDLSARGNVQLRGVTEASHPALIDDLTALDLIDRDLATEARRNITVSPFSNEDALALALEAAFVEAPTLPGKFGFVLDTGTSRWLADTSGDIRIESGAEGGLILRADGMPTGRLVDFASAPSLAVQLAHWFAKAGGIDGGRGRMAKLIASGASLPPDLSGAAQPAPAATRPCPGLRSEGALVALAFGQMDADVMKALSSIGHDLRLTPWRMILLEGAGVLPDLPGIITDPSDPVLKVVACTGAPGCPQALQATRPLARALAPLIPDGQMLHISGCAKGCAHPAPADTTLTATSDGFNLIRAGRALDPGQPFVATDLPFLLTGKT